MFIDFYKSIRQRLIIKFYASVIFQLCIGQRQISKARHMEACNHNLVMDYVSILARSTRTKNVEAHLLTLEALFITQLKPSISTRDEYKSHELVIKLFWYFFLVTWKLALI